MDLRYQSIALRHYTIARSLNHRLAQRDHSMMSQTDLRWRPTELHCKQMPDVRAALSMDNNHADLRNYV